MIFALQENGRASFERISKNYSNYPTGLHPPSPPMDLTLQCFSSALIFFFLQRYRRRKMSLQQLWRLVHHHQDEATVFLQIMHRRFSANLPKTFHNFFSTLHPKLRDSIMRFSKYWNFTGAAYTDDGKNRNYGDGLNYGDDTEQLWSELWYSTQLWWKMIKRELSSVLVTIMMIQVFFSWQQPKDKRVFVCGQKASAKAISYFQKLSFLFLTDIFLFIKVTLHFSQENLHKTVFLTRNTSAFGSCTFTPKP